MGSDLPERRLGPLVRHVLSDEIVSDSQSEPSVGCQHGASDVTCIVRAQKNNRPGDLFGTARAPLVNALRQDVVIERVAKKRSTLSMHGRVNDSRTKEVDADPLGGQFR